jgi:uncharacterized protein (TIGR02246 family)
MRKIALVTAALAISFPALAQQQIHQDIAQANQRFEQAFNSGDIGTVARLYGENAVVLPPGAPLQRGRQAIQGFWQQLYQSGLRNLKLETVDVESLGDAAREIGRFSATMSSSGTLASGQATGAAAASGAAGSSATGPSAVAGGGSAGQSTVQHADRVEGKYVVIWKRSGQGWEMDTDIWNADR